jgi:predicted nucleic acid-binding protein
VYTIDSNILIYHLQGDKRVADQLELWLLGGERLFISSVTRLELLAAPALRIDEEERIKELLSFFVLMPVDLQIADAAARLKRRYRLPMGDSIIAATAFLTDSPLVTRNLRDFRRIKEIRVQPL